MKRLVKTLQTLWREWKRSEDRKRIGERVSDI